MAAENDQAEKQASAEVNLQAAVKTCLAVALDETRIYAIVEEVLTGDTVV